MHAARVRYNILVNLTINATIDELIFYRYIIINLYQTKQYTVRHSCERK